MSPTPGTSASTSTSTDRIEKKIVLRATRARVWRAISDAGEFGTWFGMRLQGKLEPGARLPGQITDPPGYEDLKFEILVEKVEPERLVSYRWHPYAVDTKVDYSGEPTTLVELSLREVEGGVELTVVESGFDRIPEHRRAEALEKNDAGWAEQLQRVRRHVEG